MNNKHHQEPEPDGLLPAADLPSQRPREVKIDYHPQAPEGEAGKQIHPRRAVPPVPEGPDVPDPDPSPPVDPD